MARITKQSDPADVLRDQIIPVLEAKGWTRKYYADILGMPESQLSTILSIGNPSWATVMRLAAGLGISIETNPAKPRSKS